MEELVLPDLLHHAVSSLGCVDDHVCDEDDEEPERSHGWGVGQTGEQTERGRVDQTVIGKSFPALALIGRHPVGLEGEVADEVGADRDQKDVDEMRHDARSSGSADFFRGV